MNKFKNIAILAAKKSGQELIKRYKKFDRATVNLKAHHEIVTEADYLSEKIIINEIKKNFPSHDFLSEESGFEKASGEYLWIIDPIDGTTNFSMHNPLWCISIGLAKLNKKGAYDIILGVIYLPVLGDLFFAEVGKGSFLNNKKIKVSRFEEKTGKVLNTFCHGRDDKHVKRAIKYYSYQKLHGLDCRQLGSAAIEMAYVAAGRIESILIPGTNDWDVAAGVIIVREAEGRVSDFIGKEWILGEKNIIGTNSLVHEGILKVIKGI